MTFNPPYNMDVNFNGDMSKEPTVTFTDKDGNVVTRDEVEAYGASISSGDPTTPTGQYALVSSGVVTAVVSGDYNVEDAVNDKILPLPNGIVVGASWTQAGGFVNP